MAMAEEFVKRVMSDMRLRTFFVLAVAVVGLAANCAADGIITVPPSLAPGSQYRLVFVTADFYTATSSNIGDYNTDVNNGANNLAGDTGSLLAPLGTSWLDIGSTATVNAIDNIGIDSGVPIYDLEGNLVANDAGTGVGGMFSGSLFSSISTTELGVTTITITPFTGIFSIGTEAGSVGLGSGLYVDVGLSGATSFAWENYETVYGADHEPLYGISEVLTVPTPEPSTTVLLTLGGAILIGARRRMVHRIN
jgi:hypothetical protein